MRYVFAVVMVVFCVSGVMRADGRERFHVRGLDPWAVESLERGLARSPTVRALVEAITGSDLIVHVETTAALPSWFSGITRFALNTGEYRYVRITLDRDLAPDVRAATLAHELQHALELAHSGARTRAGVAALYGTIGQPVGKSGSFFDTAAAQRAGDAAWRELRGGASRSRLRSR